MKNITRISILTLLLSITSTMVFAHANDAEKETFQILSSKLDKAIEGRNFHDARETIEELLPLMKDELKKNKKELSILKKEDNPEIGVVGFEKNMLRKIAIHNGLKEMLNVSSAALRVKSDQIKKDVKEFIELS